MEEKGDGLNWLFVWIIVQPQKPVYFLWEKLPNQSSD